jgi:Conjugal transfer protein.
MPKVWNDGRQTYIKYNVAMREQEHPVLFGVYKTSFLNLIRKTQIKNSYDSKNLTHIVDGLPDEFILAMGEQELMIKRVKFNIEVSQNENKSKK